MQNQSQDAPWNTFDNMTEEEPGIDLWGFLQRRKSFVILLAIVGAALGYLYHERQVPRFRSTALLQVIHHNTDPVVESMLAERNLSDVQFVITSDKLLEPCYKNNALKELETLRNLAESTAVNRIRGMISARSQAANIVEISCEGANPSDTATIANAISKEYIDHQKESYQNAVTRLEDLLQQADSRLNDSLQGLWDDYAEFDKNSNLGSDGENPHRLRLKGIEAKLGDLIIRETELKSELMALEEALHKGGQRDALLLLIGKQAEGVPGNPTENVEPIVDNARSMFQALMPLLMEEAILAEEVGPGHPKLVALRRRIEITRAHFDQLAGLEPKPSKNNNTPVQRVDFLTVYLNSLRQELLVLEKSQERFQAMANDVEIKAKELRDEEITRANLSRRIQIETSLLEDVQQQMRDTELPTNIGGITASVLTDAGQGSLVYPKLSQFLGMGAFLGGFLGLVLGYIVEVADRSFRKPEEIIREFGIPILGHVPYMQEQKLRKIPKNTVIDRTVITLHLPRSRPSEAYRSVRTAVCFSALGSKHRVIQVTSPAAGDGKSTLAMNFAVSLAQSGKKTIIMESDFRRPKVHKLTGVDNSNGVVDVLRGGCEIPDAIQETELDGFYVMPCGSRPKDPSELITRPEYEQLLEVLRERFDYVIVDTPPVLVVTDPCSVAPRTDGVLLCVRLSRHTRDFGRRALEQLRDVGANMTGIVINGVEETDAYGYGNYSYSDYRYRYTDYNYNDGYDEKGSEIYVAESETHEAGV